MNFAVILSGGTGRRMKNLEVPKQYFLVHNKPVISYCLETFIETKSIDGFIIVAAEEWREFILKYLPECGNRFAGFADPGSSRQLSIYQGLTALKALASDEDIVVVHDAARPLVSTELLERCILAAGQGDGAMPVLPMKDTVYYSRDGQSVDSMLERRCIYAGQAPEAFRFRLYLKANEALTPQEIFSVNGSSEAALRAGMDIRLIPGEERNFKITTQGDLKRFQEIVRRRTEK